MTQKKIRAALQAMLDSEKEIYFCDTFDGTVYDIDSIENDESSFYVCVEVSGLDKEESSYEDNEDDFLSIVEQFRS
jgi:hypothetical protein